MPNTKFDAKSFNPEAFRYLRERVPNLKMNELLKSRAVSTNSDILSLFKSQDGTLYARMAMKGLLDGTAVNYDGETDITATSTKTYERGVVVVGRAKAWTEKDFSYDITGGQDFMANIAAQVAEYWDEVNQDMILSVLKGIFSMTGTKNLEFVNEHTYDITKESNGNMKATTMNTATNKACKSNKKKFTLVFMHSDVATNLENMRLITYMKYTDKDGITRDLSLGTWNGKLIVIDDSMPIESKAGFYTKAKSIDEGAMEVVASDAASVTPKQIKLSNVKPVASGYTAKVGDYVVLVDDYTEYTSYVLGDGAIDFANIGVKHPSEMSRDPKTNGGVDTLYTRERQVFAPMGISYEKTSQVSSSPTNEELENGANWTLIHSGESVAANRSFIDHKSIPIARIISRG